MSRGSRQSLVHAVIVVRVHMGAVVAFLVEKEKKGVWLNKKVPNCFSVYIGGRIL